MDAEYAMDVIDQCYQSWKDLVTGVKDQEHEQQHTEEQPKPPVKRNLSYPKLNLADLADDSTPLPPPSQPNPISTSAPRPIDKVEGVAQEDVEPPKRGLGACRNLSYPKLSLADLE
jgi:hypothetical protein